MTKHFCFHLIQLVSIVASLTANRVNNKITELRISKRTEQETYHFGTSSPKWEKSISPVGLGRLMVKLWPEEKSKQESLKSEWNKRESVCHGVKWRVEDNACSLEFLDILKYTETCLFFKSVTWNEKEIPPLVKWPLRLPYTFVSVGSPFVEEGGKMP